MNYQDDYADIVFYENKLTIQDMVKNAKELQVLNKELQAGAPDDLYEKIFYGLTDLGSNLIRHEIYSEGLKCFEDALGIINDNASTFTAASIRRDNGSHHFVNMLPIEFYTIVQTLTAYYIKTNQLDKNSRNIGTHRLIRDNSQLKAHLLSIAERELVKEACRNLRKKKAFEKLIGISHEWLAVLKHIEEIGKSEKPVLITGPSGVGKELVANAIHSEKGKGSFVPVNCAYITDDLVISELFGHEKGAFTGAIDMRIGYCEVAANGTLFLDEIAETSLKFQGTLLRFLQEREFTRLGSTKKIKFNGRIIAATNKNIWDLVDKGTFREDVYWRLEVHKISIPPLSERLDDLHELIPYLVKEVSPNKRISVEAIDVICAYYQSRKYNEIMRNKIQQVTDDDSAREKTAAFWKVVLEPIRQNNVRELKNRIEEWTSAVHVDDMTVKEFANESAIKANQSEIYEIPIYTARADYQEKHVETVKALALTGKNQASVAALFRITPPAIQQRLAKAKQNE